MAARARRLTQPIVRSTPSIAYAKVSAPHRTLPKVKDVLAVCAHPGDESFGLGAVLAAFVEQGATVRVLCFTHGEASTLGVSSLPLAELRAEELRAAADVLGVEGVQLLAYADGCLADVGLDQLAGIVEDSAAGAAAALPMQRFSQRADTICRCSPGRCPEMSQHS